MHVVELGPGEPLSEVAQRLELPTGRPVLVLVGGADGVGPAEQEAIDAFLTGVVVPVLDQVGATLVDGGTDSGVMRSVGRAAGAAGLGTPLVGVAVATLVGAGGSPLEPHHTHALLVDGTDWGDESEALADLAGVLAAGAPTATVLVNGGAVSRTDVELGLRGGRPVVTVRGTGRLADELAVEPPAGVVVLDTALPPAEQRRRLAGLLESAQPAADARAGADAGTGAGTNRRTS